MLEAITVSQLNGYIKNIFDAEELLHNISVVGEVFGVSSARGITYFSLKDENATLPCVCFYPAFAGKIVEGKQVVVTGSPNYYVKGGRLSFNVNRVEEAGEGRLYEEFLKLKAKLESEGLFSDAHKIPIPKNIKRIGVITSKDGAVIQDIKNVSWRRNPSVDIVLYPTKVQGRLAENEIAHAIDQMDKYANVDVIVVARGGGSLEDLSAYNTEIVARATYNCCKPIVSAVGHETDFTIIDFVSDLRAPTPSAAAELLTINLDEKREQLINNVARLNKASQNYLKERTNILISLTNRLQYNLERKFITNKSAFFSLKTKLVNAMQNYISQKSYEAGLNENALNKLNPKAILQKGYAKIEQNKTSLNSVKEVDYNKDIKVIFADGSLNAKPIKEEK